nr:hypothetical protein CFP56_36146 [Quercus suber]
MAIGLLDLPCEIRYIIYELVLLRETPIVLWTPKEEQQQLDIRLLRVNRAIHLTGSPIFYGRNSFELCDYGHRLSDFLLLHIGPRNAILIQHVRVDFARLIALETSSTSKRIVFDSFHADLLICCPHLRTLTALPPGLCAIDWLLIRPDTDFIVQTLLSGVKTRMGLFKNLEKLIVEGSELFLSECLVPEMEKFGWSFQIVELKRLKRDVHMTFADVELCIKYGQQERSAEKTGRLTPGST